MKVLGTLLGLYALLFIVLSHTALMTCRYGEEHMSLKGFNWKNIDKNLNDKCPKVI